MSEVRIGLIGYGLFGTHHAAAIAGTPGAVLAAIAVPSTTSQQAARAAHPDVEIHGDHQALLAREDIDAVVVVTPNGLHGRMGRDVLSAGKHLLLEKPMALQVADCDALLELAGQQDKVLAVGHELRLSSLWGGVKQLIDEGAIGDPLYVLIELLRFPYRLGSDGWRYDIRRVGNWILEEPIHFFDLARWYLSSCGEPQSVYARANSRHADHPELTDNFSATVEFPGGAYAVVSQTLAAFGHHQAATITGTTGAIWAQWSASDARSDKPTFSLRYGLGEDVHEKTFDRPTGELLELADEIAAFVECVRDGKTPPCSGVDGRWSTLLCVAAQQSVDAGRVVSVEEFVG